MKKYLIVGAVLVALIVGLWIFAPKSETTSQAPATVAPAQMAVTQAEQGQAYLYDVRSPEEYNEAHAEQATNHDVELLKAGTYPDVPKDSEIYVYCRSGNRSAEATELLVAAGYSNVTDLGGLDNMKAAGVM